MGIFSPIAKPSANAAKPTAYMAMGRIEELDIPKKQEKSNPLSNANLPGGIFTHPSVC